MRGNWGIIPRLITQLISVLRLKKRLKECQLSEAPEGVEVFCYKGKIYDREKYILLEMKKAQDTRYNYRDVKRAIIETKKELEKGGENAELIAAELCAYLRVLPEKKKKAHFYVDDDGIC